MKVVLIISLALLFPVVDGWSQELSNWKEIEIGFTHDTIAFDSLSVAATSFQLFNNGVPVDKSAYWLDPIHAKLLIKNTLKGELSIRYQVFPFAFNKPYFHRDINNVEKAFSFEKNPFNYYAVYGDKSRKATLNLGGFQKNGSISRGISVGNNQDLSVNSSMNFQLAGKVSSNINMLAVISDDNLPIQPDGNTQQLQDFDQVYIQLFNDKSRLTAGDFRIQEKRNHFLKYFKKAQGGTFSTRYNNGNSMGVTRLSAAISRGKFARNIIQGVEGNQGPYRLVGAESEKFIIVLSGTERVYIDGKLLTRGQEYDYIVNYNTSEVTFTARQLITKDKRIVIEFQYSDKNYARSLIQVSNRLVGNKYEFNVELYSERDAKNQPLQQELSSEQKFILGNIGDDLVNAIGPSAVETEYSDNLILYEKVDSTVNGQSYSPVYVFTTDPKKGKYQLTFSEIGFGNGDYIQKDATVVGKVYEWVAPVNGQAQGSYSPVVRLVTPKQKDMLLISGVYRLAPRSKIKFEGVLSNHDQNTFSAVDDADNIGTAGVLSVENNIPLSISKGIVLSSNLGFEYVDSKFRYIERFRKVEFNRNWNLRGMNISGSQRLPVAEIGISKVKFGSLSYSFKQFDMGKEYDAKRNQLIAIIDKSGLKLNSISSLMESNGTFNSQFIKNTSRLSKDFGALTIGVKDIFENNLFYQQSLAKLNANSYEFLEIETFITTADTAESGFYLSYVDRKDKGVSDSLLVRATHGRSANFRFDFIKKPTWSVSGKSSYRILEIKNESVTNQTADSTLVNRIEYTVRIFKGALQSSAFYEVGSGLEVQKEFTFLEVPVGQGVYVHKDYNDNGIKEINEFEISPFGYDANYIKVFTPTNKYVKTYNNQVSFVLNLRPKAIWRKKNGLRGMLARFRNQFTYRLNKKTANDNFSEYANPMVFKLSNVLDSSLISLNKSLRNSIYFNKTNPIYGLDINYQEVQGNTLLTYGFDTRSNVFYNYRFRLNLGTAIMLTVEQKQGTKVLESEFFSNRNYYIKSNELKPKVSYQHQSMFRISLFYEQKDKRNISELSETANFKKIGTEFKLMAPKKGSLLLTGNYINITYPYQSNTTLAFEILEGLQNGNNITWSLTYQKTLAKNLQLSINYNGRSSETAPTIHTGGVQVRVNF